MEKKGYFQQKFNSYELKEDGILMNKVLEDWLLSLMSTLVMGFGPQD